MKKIPVMGMMGILLAASFVTPVSAHGHHHNQTNVAAASVCEVCTLEGCEQTDCIRMMMRHTMDIVIRVGIATVLAERWRFAR